MKGERKIIVFVLVTILLLSSSAFIGQAKVTNTPTNKNLITNNNDITSTTTINKEKDGIFEAKKILHCKNTWNQNYWNISRFFPKPIFGRIGKNYLIPWLNFDWHPAKGPYEIP